jgi:hypothetical protein
MVNHKKAGVFAVGFIDPNIIFKDNIAKWPVKVEKNIFRFLHKQRPPFLFELERRELQDNETILIVLCIFYFAYSMLSVINEVCLRIVAYWRG